MKMMRHSQGARVLSAGVGAAVMCSWCLPGVATADIPPSPLTGIQADQLLERRRQAEQEHLRNLEITYGQTPSVDPSPPLIPRHLFWPLLGAFNAVLVAIWLLVARQFRLQSASSPILLTGVRRSHRRRSHHGTAAAAGDPAASNTMWTLLSMLRRSSRHRRHRHHRHGQHRRSRHHHSHDHHRSSTPRSIV